MVVSVHDGQGSIKDKKCTREPIIHPELVLVAHVVIVIHWRCLVVGIITSN